MNKLAFGLNTEGNSIYLYYCDPTTGAVPVTNGLLGWGPTWSPNNSSIMFVYWPPASLAKVTPLASTVKVISHAIGVGTLVQWKR
jgi:hypothetical protein